MRDGRCGIVLEVVRRQHIVGRRDESFKEPPGAAGGPPQRLRFLVGQRPTGSRRRRQADKSRDRGRRQPKQDERKRHRPRPMARRQRDNRSDPANPDRARHSTRIARQVEAGPDRRLRGRGPFEQMASADAEAPEGAADRVGHEPGLVRQERNGQRRKRKGEPRIVAERAHMARHRHARAARRNGGKDRNERWQRNRQDDEQRPEER